MRARSSAIWARSSAISVRCTAAAARCSEISVRSRVFSSTRLCFGVPPLPMRRPFGLEELDVVGSCGDGEVDVGGGDGAAVVELESGAGGRVGCGAATGAEGDVADGTTEEEAGGGEVGAMEEEEEVMTIDGRAATAAVWRTVDGVTVRAGVACVEEEEEEEESDVVRTFFVLRKSSRVRGGEGEVDDLGCVGVGEVEGDCLAAARLLPRLVAEAGVKPSASMGEEEDEEVEREGEDFPCIQAVIGSVGTCMSSSMGEGGSGSSSGMSSLERSTELLGGGVIVVGGVVSVLE